MVNASVVLAFDHQPDLNGHDQSSATPHEALPTTFLNQHIFEEDDGLSCDWTPWGERRPANQHTFADLEFQTDAGRNYHGLEEGV